MRDYFFRAKRASDNEWIYGSLCETAIGDGYYMHNAFSDKSYIIKQDTIGQFVGLKDKNSKEVYEGDIFICANYDENKSMYGVVKYRNTFSEYRNHNPCGFVIEWIGNNGVLREDLPFWCNNTSDAEVVGNIYDNPKLLGGMNNVD